MRLYNTNLIVKKLWLIYTYTIVFIAVYNPPIYGVQIIRIVYLLSIIHFLIKKTEIPYITLKLFAYAFALIVYVVVDSLFHLTFDFNMLGIWRLFIFIFVGKYVFDCLQNRAKVKIDTTTALKLLAYTSIPQYFIIVISYVVPELKTFLINLNGANAISFEMMQIYALTRGIGWTYGQFSGFSIILGMSFMCQIALWIYEKKKNQFGIVQLIILIISIIGGSLCARTYQLIVACAIIYWIRVMYAIGKGIKVFKIITFSLISLAICLPILFNLLANFVTEDTLKWAFEFYYNYEESGTIESKSTNQLMNEMWAFPDKISTWFVGDGRINAIEGIHPMYSGSDAGFICALWGWGIMGSVIYYIAIFKVYQYSARMTQDIIIRTLIWFLMFIVLIYNVKGIETGFSIICFIYIGLLYSSKFKTKLNSKFDICGG